MAWISISICFPMLLQVLIAVGQLPPAFKEIPIPFIIIKFFQLRVAATSTSVCVANTNINVHISSIGRCCSKGTFNKLEQTIAFPKCSPLLILFMCKQKVMQGFRSISNLQIEVSCQLASQSFFVYKLNKQAACVNND